MVKGARPTIWEHAQSRGVPRRDVLDACASMIARPGLPASAAAAEANALETRPRLPFVSCCCRRFVGSSLPLAAEFTLENIFLGEIR